MYEVTAKHFDKALMTSKLVIVDFKASWCSPCKVMQNSINAVEGKYGHSVKFISVDCDKERELFERFDVTHVPTLIAFKCGEIINRQTGAMLESQLIEKLDRLLKR